MNILLFLTPKSQVAYLEDHYTVRSGLEKMLYHHYTAIPVISKDGLYVGTVTEGDFLRYIASSDSLEKKDMENIPITSIIRMGWNPPCNANESIENLMQKLMEQNFVPVVDDRGVFVGIVTRKSILKNKNIFQK